MGCEQSTLRPAAARGGAFAPIPLPLGAALPPPPLAVEAADRSAAGRAALVAKVRLGVIGAGAALPTPFGARALTYADYTASGRSLRCIEDAVRDVVLPLYANTHTEASETGRQTGRFREDARRMVAGGVGAGDDDAVVFVGSGATGAIQKLLSALGVARRPTPGGVAESDASPPPESQWPVVFISPYEHHSNELVWRESLVTVVTVPLRDCGAMDLAALEAELVAHADRPVRIGSFSAGSNVTGVLTDVDAVAVVLHRHGALAFFDFAAAAPYVPIRMNAPLDPERFAARPEGDAAEKDRPYRRFPPAQAALCYKDAVFISPHKFPGGPQTPGVLVAKRRLLAGPVPTMPGGGTVLWVSDGQHEYDPEPTHREEAGTPAIVDCIRAGLVFALKDAVGGAHIQQLEAAKLEVATRAWAPAVHIGRLVALGPDPAVADRLSIVSLLLLAPAPLRAEGHASADAGPLAVAHEAPHRGELFLHHNFVTALMSDLFGVQGRGGCSCAGPYGQRLLHIAARHVESLRAAVHRAESLKPGWFRVNFNYFLSDEEAAFVAKAVAFVAALGWRFLPLYALDNATGQWVHRARLAASPPALHSGHGNSLADVTTHGERSPLAPQRLGDVFDAFIASAPEPATATLGGAASPRPPGALLPELLAAEAAAAQRLHGDACFDAAAFAAPPGPAAAADGALAGRYAEYLAAAERLAMALPKLVAGGAVTRPVESDCQEPLRAFMLPGEAFDLLGAIAAGTASDDGELMAAAAE